jgi:hypothetical protein
MRKNEKNEKSEDKQEQFKRRFKLRIWPLPERPDP